MKKGANEIRQALLHIPMDNGSSALVRVEHKAKDSERKLGTLDLHVVRA